MSADQALLSVVLPAYNEAHHLAASLGRVREELAAMGEPWEILVVDDGSGDATATVAAAALGGDGRVLTLPRNQGKGAAVKAGMLAAQGTLRLFLDADLSVEPRYMREIVAALRGGADVAITSRRLPGSRLVRRQPVLRETLGTFYRTVATTLLAPGLSDLTCGMKGFTAAATEAVFPWCRIPRFGFDVEALYVAHRKGLRVTEIPVDWADDPDTRVRLLRDTVGSLVELLQVPLNGLLGRYDRRAPDRPSVLQGTPATRP